MDRCPSASQPANSTSPRTGLLASHAVRTVTFLPLASRGQRTTFGRSQGCRCSGVPQSTCALTLEARPESVTQRAKGMSPPGDLRPNFRVGVSGRFVSLETRDAREPQSRIISHYPPPSRGPPGSRLRRYCSEPFELLSTVKATVLICDDSAINRVYALIRRHPIASSSP